jgi:hypothetical protein
MTSANGKIISEHSVFDFPLVKISETWIKSILELLTYVKKLSYNVWQYAGKLEDYETDLQG